MSVSSPSWERRLVVWAHEALENACFPETIPVDASLLARAHTFCRELTRLHSRTFFMASSLLPRAKCEAVRALYAFCRVSDDLVDGHDGGSRELLDGWRRLSLQSAPQPDPDSERGLVALAWADARSRYRIPARYAEQLIQGVARDIGGARYETFEELTTYCYGVASTVGLMSMHIIGFTGPEAIPYAVRLGVALQLTNILRDVGEDWRMGRLYLPRVELAAFGLCEEDIARGRTDANWQSFLRFQIERTRRLYEEAMPGIAMLHRDGRMAIAAAAELYRQILDDIEAHAGDVFQRRAFVSTWDKLRRLPGIWWRSSVQGYRRPDGVASTLHRSE